MRRFLATVVLVAIMSLPSEEKKEFTIATTTGPVQAFSQSAEPVKQEFIPLSEDEYNFILWCETKAKEFVQTYLGEEASVTLQSCDDAFSTWQREENKRFSENEVICFLGAFLGQECVRELDMRWMTVTDEYGSDYAVCYTKGAVVGYPHSSVKKRIKTNTHIFMVPIFNGIKQRIESDAYDKYKN